MPAKTQPTQPVEELETTFQDILTALKQPLDPSMIKERYGFRDRNGNTHNLSYIEWQTAADILDTIAPEWTFDTSVPTVIGAIAVCKATITINGVSRTGIGTGTADTEMGIKKSEHDALKRAAVKFGVARTLYQSESGFEESEGSVPDNQYAPQTFPPDCRARTESDLASEKQIGAIRAICKSADMDADLVTYEKTGCEMSEINKRAASALIDWLKNGGGQESSTPAPYIPPVTQQLPAGVTRGMPVHTGPSTQAVTRGPSPATSSSMAAKNPGELATAKQLGMIRAVSEKLGMIPALECVALYHCSLDELSRHGASAFIDYLKAQENNGAPIAPTAPTREWDPSVDQDFDTAAPPIPPAPIIPASAAQGRFAGVGQKKAVAHYCQKVGYDVSDVVAEYTHGRSRDINQMSEAEAAVAIEALSAM